MLQYSTYSVISPEGCASILWKDAGKMREAAAALRLTAQDLNKLGIADKVITEPLGGAQRDRKATFAAVGKMIETMLAEVSKIDAKKRRMARRKKFIELGNKTLAA